MKRSFLIAGVLGVAAVGWVASGQLGDGRAPAGQKPPANLGATDAVPSVRVRVQTAQPHAAKVILHGRTEADRKVEIKAETHGRIQTLAAEKGDRVKAGDPVARIAPDERPARLAEATALREQRRIEYEASSRLNEKGFRAETQLAAAKAALDAAEAAVKVAEMALAYTTITAPFDGVVVDRSVEIGDFVESGDPVARLIDLDPLLVVVQLSERDMGRLAIGSLARARLITGEDVEGVVSYISPEADAATRTFRIEVETPNPDGALSDGVSAEVTLPLGQVLAHRVSPSVLTLGNSGDIGVKTLTPGNTVAFLPVKVIGEESDGVWIAGLPPRVTLITVGQEFIVDGQAVRAIDEQTLAPITPAQGPDAPGGDAS